MPKISKALLLALLPAALAQTSTSVSTSVLDSTSTSVSTATDSTFIQSSTVAAVTSTVGDSTVISSSTVAAVTSTASDSTVIQSSTVAAVTSTVSSSVSISTGVPTMSSQTSSAIPTTSASLVIDGFGSTSTSSVVAPTATPFSGTGRPYRPNFQRPNAPTCGPFGKHEFNPRSAKSCVLPNARPVSLGETFQLNWLNGREVNNSTLVSIELIRSERFAPRRQFTAVSTLANNVPINANADPTKRRNRASYNVTIPASLNLAAGCDYFVVIRPSALPISNTTAWSLSFPLAVKPAAMTEDQLKGLFSCRAALAVGRQAQKSYGRHGGKNMQRGGRRAGGKNQPYVGAGEMSPWVTFGDIGNAKSIMAGGSFEEESLDVSYRRQRKVMIVNSDGSVSNLMSTGSADGANAKLAELLKKFGIDSSYGAATTVSATSTSAVATSTSSVKPAATPTGTTYVAPPGMIQGAAASVSSGAISSYALSSAFGFIATVAFGVLAF